MELIVSSKDYLGDLPHCKLKVSDVLRKPFFPVSYSLDAYNRAYKDFGDYEIDIGSLFWPVGASRWSIGLFLATSSQLEGFLEVEEAKEPLKGIRELTLDDPEASDLHLITKKSLVMRTHPNVEDEFLTTDLWMLPPRPLSQVFYTSEEEQKIFKYPKDHLNGLWLITLVDDRYWWWTKRIKKLTTPLCASWKDLLVGILEECEIPYGDLENPHKDYCFAPKAMRSLVNETNVPVLLDIIGHSINQKICMGYDGKVFTESAENSRLTLDSELETYDKIISGGQFNFDEEILYNDVSYLLPETFRFDTGETFKDVQIEDIEEIPENYVTRLGHVHTFNLTHTGYIKKTGLCSSLVPPSGMSDIDYDKKQSEDYRKRYIRDWITLRRSNLDATLGGIVPWVPNACLDAVIFRYTLEDATTQLMREPFTDFSEDIWVETLLGGDACSEGAIACGQCVGINHPSVNGQNFIARQLPYHPEGTQLSPPDFTIGVPTGTETESEVATKYPNWKKPPYLVKFCLGRTTGNVALDFETWEPCKIFVYWNGKLVASKDPTGRYALIQTCSACGPAKGRITFYKDQEYPTTATVVVDSDYTSTTNYTASYNRDHPAWNRWLINMRCVDSIPEPAPKCLACDLKLSSVPSQFSDLREFLVGVSLATGGSGGGFQPSTPMCGATEASFQANVCGQEPCTIAPTIEMKFTKVPEGLKKWKDDVFELKINSKVGGYTGIIEHDDGTIEYYNLRLSALGQGMFDLRIRTLFSTDENIGFIYANESYFIQGLANCSCTPFSLTFVQNSPYTNYPGVFEIEIKEPT